jgi:DMSO reductase family type II enzyme heme b subunit
MTAISRRHARLAAVAATLAAVHAYAAPPAGLKTEPVKPTPVAAEPAAGKALYERYCVQCHGAEGKGDGPAADFVYPRPRDFTLGVYKVRSTPSGQLPTDHDLFRVISEGLPGTSMPAWKKFIGEAERWQLVHHLKTLETLGLFKDEAPKEQVSVASAPEITPALVARGKTVYREKKCWQCHGALGRGDGESAGGMKDEWGHPIRPVNFTKGWRYRGGDRIEDIYRTFTTGFNGTPMPSFLDAIPAAEDRWALAAYVKSLTRAPRMGQVLKARAVEGDIPADPYAGAWEEAEFLDFPLAGQIIVKPRWFKPAHDVITARALYTATEVAILLEWDDGTHNRGSRGKPPDQAAVQFPTARTPADEKPYFVLGDARNPVDYWRWSAGGGLSRFTASGAARLTERAAGALRAEGGYKDGQYRVILRRPRAASDDQEIGFEPGRFIPLAFHLWDGEQGEEGLEMAISTWYYLLLEPKTPPTVYAWPLALGAIALGGELWLLRRLRRRKPGEGS